MTIRKGSQYVRCLLSSTDSFTFYLLFKILKISSTSGWLSSRIIWSSSFNKISLYDIHVYCLAFYSTYIDETISNKVPFSYTLFIYLRNSLSWLCTPTGYSNFQWKTTKFILIKFENDDSDILILSWLYETFNLISNSPFQKQKNQCICKCLFSVIFWTLTLNFSGHGPVIYCDDILCWTLPFTHLY